MERLIDLHVHSTASDGSLSPTELVATARNTGLSAIAITDHDTISGIAEAVNAGREHDMEVIPGVEISVDFTGVDGRPASLHILGYFIDYKSEQLLTALNNRQNDRNNRNRQMLDKLNKLGIALGMEQVMAFQHSRGSLGRPHFAQALVAHGYVKDISQAFSLYLARGASAYVHKRRLSQQEGIALITGAGGVAALAHPAHLLNNYRFFTNLLKQLKCWGMQALETYYGEYTPQQMERLMNIARKCGFAACGGSDFHGQAKPWLKLGNGRGGLKVPYSCLEELKQKLAAPHRKLEQ